VFGRWLASLLLVCEMVLTLGVECLEIGPRPIYLLENIFQTIYILKNKTEHSSCRPRGQFFFKRATCFRWLEVHKKKNSKPFRKLSLSVANIT
jgi:hypothetical protein